MLGRVHLCPGEDCAWLFLDASRSGRRLWCSEETCGYSQPGSTLA
jgi:predicted RNA-binding Zn ribbon-like protein